jgi:hypothetical protein
MLGAVELISFASRRLGFFDMQTTMDDGGNLKNNTWCSDSGNDDYDN